jgi:hypothetical protein
LAPLPDQRAGILNPQPTRVHAQQYIEPMNFRLLIDTTATTRLPRPKNPGECHLYLARGCHLYIAATYKGRVVYLMLSGFDKLLTLRTACAPFLAIGYDDVSEKLIRKVECPKTLALRTTDPLASNNLSRRPDVVDRAEAFAASARYSLCDGQIRLACMVD